MSVYVQFLDETKTEVISVFCCPQDPEFYPSYAEIEESDMDLYGVYLDFMKKFESQY